MTIRNSRGLKTALLIFLVSLCFAAGYKEKQFYSFEKGLNTKSAPNVIDDASCVNAENVLFDEKLGIVSREKCDTICKLPVSTNTLIHNSYVFKKDDGTTWYLINVGTMVIATSKLETNPTWTIVAGNLSELFPVNFAGHYNKVWCTNGVDDVFSWDGATKTSYSFIPKGKFILSGKNRLWIGYTLDEPNYVYFSAVSADPKESTDWNVLDAVEFGKGTGQQITGLKDFQNIIYAFLEKSFYGVLGDIDSGLGDFGKRLYSNNFGSLSQNSIANYKNDFLFLDRKSIMSYGGGGVKDVGGNIEPEIKRIGIVNGTKNRWTLTSSADYSTGTFVDCYNNAGTVEVSTSQKKWSTVVDFSPAFTGSTQEKIDNQADGEVVINTATSSGWTKWNLKHDKTTGILMFSNPSGDQFGNVSDGSVEEMTDADDDSWTFPYVTSANSYSYLEFVETAGGTIRPKSLRIRFQFAIYDASFNQILPESYWNYGGVTSFHFFTYSGDLTPASQSTIAISPNLASGKVQNIHITFPDYDDTDKGYPDTIRLYLGSPLVNQGGRYYYGAKIYDVSASSYSPTTTRFSSGVYISPIYDTGDTDPYFKMLDWSGDTDVSGSTQTITMFTRSDNDSDMSSPTAWYQVGTASVTNSDIDENRYFQWMSSMTTSTTTVTPILWDTTLEYATTNYATFTSEVFNVGKAITSWSNFIAYNSGTVYYDFRASDTLFAKDNSTLAWTPITSGAVISTPTTQGYIQVRYRLSSKDAKVYSSHVLWNTADATVGGLQDVASINFDDRYYLATSSRNSYNDIIYIYDTKEAWTRFTKIPVASFFANDDNLYVCSSTQPVILKMYSSGGSEAPFNAFWTSKHTPLDNINAFKLLRTFYTLGTVATGSDFSFDYILDSTTTVNSKRISLASDMNTRYQPDANKKAKNFYFTVRSTNAFTLQGFSVHYEDEELR